jgi:hypothetical protein
MAYTLIQRGEIPTIRIGKARRVRPEDLIKYIEGNMYKMNQYFEQIKTKSTALSYLNDWERAVEQGVLCRLQSLVTSLTTVFQQRPASSIINHAR